MDLIPTYPLLRTWSRLYKGSGVLIQCFMWAPLSTVSTEISECHREVWCCYSQWVGIEDRQETQGPSRPGAGLTEGKSLAQNLNSQGPDSFNCMEVTQGSLAGPGLERWQNKVIQPAFPEVTRQLFPDSVFVLSW